MPLCVSKLFTSSVKLTSSRNPLVLGCRTYRSAVPKLSPTDVNLILRGHEHTIDFPDGPIKYYDSNQLPSNSPMEDARTEGTFIHGSGKLFGVFDGHAGQACAQVASKRILRYLAASLTDPAELRNQLLGHQARSYSFLKCHNDRLEFVPEIRDIYENSFAKFAHELINNSQRMRILQSDGGDSDTTNQLIVNAFLRLDQDLSEEALEHPSPRTLSVAMSGSVACVAHIDQNNLRVASVGDCVAVLGSVNDTGQWVAKKMTQEHNTENQAEVRRILSEHPPSERETAIRLERLLGQLAPLRALGDFRYKWSKKVLEQFVVPNFGENVIPLHYHTPPYLTCRPDITHHVLNAKDRFLILATDGLWDMMSPMQVVRLVGEHMSGKEFLEPLEVPKEDVKLGELQELLAHRKIGLKKKPLDKNSATHLIRHALGGTDYGVEHSKLSHILTLPSDVVRLFRDDITVTIIYFNSEHLESNY